jgi:hypothetical protein
MLFLPLVSEAFASKKTYSKHPKRSNIAVQKKVILGGRLQWKGKRPCTLQEFH